MKCLRVGWVAAGSMRTPVRRRMAEWMRAVRAAVRWLFYRAGCKSQKAAGGFELGTCRSEADLGLRLYYHTRLMRCPLYRVAVSGDSGWQ